MKLLLFIELCAHLALGASATPAWAAPHGGHAKKHEDTAPVTTATPIEKLATIHEGDVPFAGKVVGTIEVKGLKRIERDAVLAKLVTKPGARLSANQIRSDIEALFAMGFFDDIDVQGEAATPPNGDKVNLTVNVRERPVITAIKFEGNEQISTSDLKEVTKVKEWSILDVNKVKEDTKLLQKHYEEKGYYLAKINFEITVPDPKKPDEVELTFRVNDYEKIQIKRITFLNNKRFSDTALKNVLAETREGGAFSFLTSAGSFKESSFKQDLQRLTYWYLDHGYVKFRYENPVVTVSDDKKWVYISIYVDEGEQYNMASYDFSGDLLFPKEELHNELTLKEGETFGITKRNADIQRLTEKYQDLGYAFTNVVPKMHFNDEARTVDIEYGFEKGNLVYFGEISVVGNTKTHDKVIRRELKIAEGELYSGTKLRVSRENVERLGFFAPGEVIFNSITPKGKTDILNIEISVKERSTGTITLGAGYGSSTGVFFQASIGEINLLGRGQNLSFSAQFARDNGQQQFNLGFTEPYFLDSLWSAGSDLYYIAQTITNTYTTRRLGADLRFGHPIADYVYAYITYKLEGLRIADNGLSAVPPGLLISDEGLLSSVVWSVVRDKRNNRFETTDGNYQSLSLETAGLGGDKHFIKWTANNRYYKRLVGDLVFRTSAEVGDIQPLEDKAIPFSERFRLGGPNNMKGFQFYSVGPQVLGTDNQTVITVGGTFEAFSLFELEYPLIREAGLKWVLFFDVGNTWNGVPPLNQLPIRADYGFGIRWFSPIGPLRFEFGYPINPQNGESSPQFQFFIGPPF